MFLIYPQTQIKWKKKFYRIALNIFVTITKNKENDINFVIIMNM